MSEKKPLEELQQRVRDLEAALGCSPGGQPAGAGTPGRHCALFHRAGVGMAVADGSGEIIDCNAAFDQLLGLGSGAPEPRNLVKLVHGDHARELAAALERLAAGEEACRLEARFPVADREPLWASVTLSCLSPDRLPRHFLVLLQNLGQLKKAQTTLQMLEKAVNTTRVGITLTDLEGRIIFTNPAEARLHGYTVEEMVGQQASELAPSGQKKPRVDVSEIQTWQRESLNTRRDGSVFPVHLISDLVTDGPGNPLAIVTVCEDITERKRAEQDLRSSEERFRLAFENSPDAIALIRQEDDTFLEVNRGFCRLTEWQQEEAVGRPTADLRLWNHRRIQELLKRRLIAEESLPQMEIRFRTRSGESRSGLFSANRVQLNGEPHFLVIIRDIEDLKQAESAIRDLAYFDPLTRLPNRSRFRERLEQAMAQAEREDRLLGILFLDLDRFKDVNDTLGHDRGDLLLMLVAERLGGCIRRSDTLARLGGDEFVALLTGLHSEADASRVAEHVLEALARPFRLQETEVFVSASIGVVIFPHNGRDADTLLKHADLAMYAAKDRGRNAFQFFSPAMNARIHKRLELETRLRQALAGEELSLAYQPQFDIGSGRLVGLEAVCRWRRRGRWIPPERFIPIAEETGLIRPLGEWVLVTACRQLRALQEWGFPGIRMAVNISGRQFRQPDFIEFLDRILEETGTDPSRLELELTESVLMEVTDASIETLQALRSRSIHLAIDDFGTGYSSLSYLKNFPLDRIKIDRQFIADVTTNPDDAAITEAIIAMARSLGLRAMAEGVESVDQLEYLYAKGCQEAQGFLLGHPMAEAPLRRFLDGSLDREGRCSLPPALGGQGPGQPPAG